MVVRSLLPVGRSKAFIVCLQDTKINTISEEVVRSLWGGRWVRCICDDAVGAAGGVFGDVGFQGGGAPGVSIGRLLCFMSILVI